MELSIDGDTVALLTDAPWQAELNIANVTGGLHQLKATAFFPDSVTDDDRLQIVVAGDPLSMPLAEHFTEGFGICSALLPRGRVCLEPQRQGLRNLFGDEWPEEQLWITAVCLHSGERVAFGRLGSGGLAGRRNCRLALLRVQCTTGH